MTGKIFENALRGLGDLEIVGDVRGSHFMMGIEFVKDRTNKESFDDELNVAYQIVQECQNRGLITRSLGNILILSPTLVMNEAQIAEIEGALRESISTVSSRLLG